MVCDKILFYCQSLVGIGHLTACIQVIKELIPYYEVDLIYGGIDCDVLPQLNGLTVLQLPALLLNESGELYHPPKHMPVNKVWEQRAQSITSFLSPYSHYKAIVIEFYPFGRRRFKQEIRTLCRQVRILSGEIPIFSFVREILVPEDADVETKILQIVNNEINTVLVRGDPKVVEFNETFNLATKLQPRLFYTGYVTRPDCGYSSERKKQILVSQGGGGVGRNLLIAAIQAAALLPEYQFIVAVGAQSTHEDIDAFKAFRQSSNVNIVPFLQDFRKHLSTSVLSINMGGDNTLLDMIATKTPSLAFPYAKNSEQKLRIEKFAKLHLITELNRDDLKPQTLKRHIINALNKTYPAVSIDLNGAFNASKKIRDVITAYQNMG